jgi:hypothetical protein
MYQIYPEHDRKYTDGAFKKFFPIVSTGDTAEKFGQVESGNSYTEINPDSSAIGKYQIMVTANLDSLKKYINQYYKNNPEEATGEATGRKPKQGTQAKPGEAPFFNNFKSNNPEYFGGQ